MHDSAEKHLIIACCKTSVDSNESEYIRKLCQESINWDDLLLKCIRQKVLPLVYENLEKFCSEIVPKKVVERFDQASFENSTHSVFLSGSLLNFLKLLEQNGIKAIPFKGPVLAENYYGDPGLRQYVDVDILVSKSDALEAIKILVYDGFSPEDGFVIDDKRGKQYIDKEFNYTLSRYDGRLNIDLQWDLSARFASVPITMELLKDRFETGTLTGKPIQTIRSEEMLCYLCIHGSRHRWAVLDYVCCVNELIQSRPDLDWEIVFKFAKQIKCFKTLLLGLSLCDELFTLSLPEKIHQMINDQKNVQELKQESLSTLFSNYAEDAMVDSKFDMFTVKLMDSKWERIWYCCRMIFIPTKEDLRRFPLPSFLSFLLYLLRPMRLIAEHGKRKFKSI